MPEYFEEVEQQPKLQPGIYQHYKGPEYQVLGLVKHSETDEWLVCYRALYGDYGYWVRPYAMFVETITDPSGQPIQRFTYKADSFA